MVSCRSQKVGEWEVPRESLGSGLEEPLYLNSQRRVEDETVLLILERDTVWDGRVT